MEVKRLYRSRKERMIAGVCGGLAEYLNTDPTLIRVIFALLTLFTAGFGGVLAYLVLVFIIPEEPEGASPPSSPPA